VTLPPVMPAFPLPPVIESTATRLRATEAAEAEAALLVARTEPDRQTPGSTDLRGSAGRVEAPSLEQSEDSSPEVAGQG